MGSVRIPKTGPTASDPRHSASYCEMKAAKPLGGGDGWIIIPQYMTRMFVIIIHYYDLLLPLGVYSTIN